MPDIYMIYILCVIVTKCHNLSCTKALDEATKSLEAWLKVPDAKSDHTWMHNATHIVHTYILAKNTHIYAATGAAPAATAPIHSIWSMEVIFMHLCNTN